MEKDEKLNKTLEFMSALAELEEALVYQIENGDGWESLGLARAKLVSSYSSNIIIQSDDSFLECYRIAIQNKASDAQLDSILKMIAKEKGIRI